MKSEIATKCKVPDHLVLYATLLCSFSLVLATSDIRSQNTLFAKNGCACFQASGSPVAASLPLASAHFASPHQVQAVPLSPFALRLGFPALLAGRHSCDYDGDSVPVGSRLVGDPVPSR
jgi:hypothetical protein